MDGNGRMGRLWQTLILKNWKPIFSSLPVEIGIRKKQALYYENLHKSDQNASSVEFIEFMLPVILDVLKMRLIEMTVPDKPQSPLQKYRITEKGKLKARIY